MNDTLFTVTYDDGQTETLKLNLFDNMQAERHLHAQNRGGKEEASAEYTAFAIYVHLRKLNKVNSEDFEVWASRVASLDATTEESTDPLA